MLQRKTSIVCFDGTNRRRIKYPTLGNWEIIRFNPITKSNKFEFSVKLYSCYGGNFMVGILEEDHPLKIENKDVGFNRDFKHIYHHPSTKTENVTSDIFRVGEIVTLKIDKFEKKIEFEVNDNKVGELIVNDFAPAYFMAIAFCNRSGVNCDFELVHFRDVEYYIQNPKKAKEDCEFMTKLRKIFVGEVEDEEGNKTFKDLKKSDIIFENSGRNRFELKKDDFELTYSYSAKKEEKVEKIEKVEKKDIPVLEEKTGNE